MRHGARSFVQKPWEDVTLLEILQREIDEAQATKRSDAKQQREFEDARLIQRGLLPTTTPQLAGLKLASSWQPANGVGGDCFDMLTFGTGAMGVYIADVAGKGVPAALLMSNLQAAVRAFAQEAAAPGSVAASVNRLLCRNMASGRFVTFCYARIDVAAGKLTYANAGHNPPLLVRANGTIDKLAPAAPCSASSPRHLRAGGLRAPPRRSADPLHRRHQRRTERRRRRVRRRWPRGAGRRAPRARRGRHARRDAAKTSRRSTSASTRTTRP